jgi:hypothetical protein
MVSETKAAGRTGFHRVQIPYVSMLYRTFRLKMLTTFQKSAQALRTGELERFYGTIDTSDFFLIAPSRTAQWLNKAAAYNHREQLPPRPSQTASFPRISRALSAARTAPDRLISPILR